MAIKKKNALRTGDMFKELPATPVPENEPEVPPEETEKEEEEKEPIENPVPVMSPKQIMKDHEASMAMEKSESLPPAKTNGMKRPVGMESFDAEDLLIPLLKIVQFQSDEASEDCTPGSFVNNLTQEPVAIGTTSTPAQIDIIPIQYRKQQLLFYGKNPKSTIAAIKERLSGDQVVAFNEMAKMFGARHTLCMATNGLHGEGVFGYGSPFNSEGKCKRCPMSKWGDDGVPPVCTMTHSYFVLVPGYDFPIPMLISFYKTSAKAGAKLGSQLAFSSVPIWKRKFRLSLKYVEDERGKYFFIDQVRPAGVSDDELAKKGEFFYNVLNTREVEIYETPEDEIVDIAEEGATEGEKKNQEIGVDDESPF